MKSIGRLKLIAIILLFTSLFSGCDSGYDIKQTEEYETGYEDGYSKGHEEGYSEGYETGYYNGQEDGYKIGYDDCVSEGYDICYFGYTKGYLDGNATWFPFSNLEYVIQDDSFYDEYLQGYLDGYLSLASLSPQTPMIDVSRYSEAIIEIGYSIDDSNLFIKWVPGNLYVYYGVDEWTFIDLLTADSIGGFANDNIKGVYEYKKLSK